MSSDALEITVNGEPRHVEAKTVAALIEGEGFDPGRPGLAVAINGMVVPRREWDSRTLAARDSVEIVKPFSGG